MTSLFLGALLGVPSWLKLAKRTRKPNWQRLVRYAEALNHEVFKQLHPHWLRHTTAVFLLKAGVDCATDCMGDPFYF